MRRWWWCVPPASGLQGATGDNHPHMLYLISPAKSLDFETPVGDMPHTLRLQIFQVLDRGGEQLVVSR